MNRLVALCIPGGASYVDAVRRIWDEGDAVFPVDQRLPKQSQSALIEHMAASAIVDSVGETSVAGTPVETGDALVVATSGSTGLPKGVVLTHDALTANAEATNSYLDVESNTDKWLACLPLSHVGGFSVVVRALHSEVALEVHDGFDADRVSEAAQNGATLVSLVPTAMGRIDTAHFRKVLVGGSAVPSNRPSNVIATYGMTETGSGVIYDRRPLEGVELRIQQGEIQIRCPMLFRCYRDGSDPRTGDGWFPSGDAGSLDTDGLLTVHGRKGDMIITGGENVWPVAVERLLESASGVAECAIVGRPDPEWGQIVTAVVVPLTNPPILADLREHVKASLPGYCAPRRLELVDRLPRTSLGKLQRHRL